MIHWVHMTGERKKNSAANEWMPSKEQIRQIYQQGDARGRALLLVLYQGGFSETDVSSLNIEQLPSIQTHEGHYPITLHREKTDLIQKTCISEEAVHDIKAMLRERGNPQSGPLFLSQKGTRLDARSINDIVKDMVAKAYGDEESKKFKTKNFRRAYNYALLRANLTKQVKDCLLGSKRVRAEDTHPISEARIVKAYSKAFKHLTVNHETQSRKDIERLDTAINTLVERLDEKDREVATLQQAIEHIREISLEQTEKTWQQLTETKQQLDSIREAFQAFLKRVKRNSDRTLPEQNIKKTRA